MAGFNEPLFLFLLFLVPFLAWTYAHFSRKKAKEAMAFSHLGFVKAALRRTSKRQHWMFGILALAIVLLIFALADPHIPLKQTKEGVNVVLVIDVSGSMQATDYQPTRLEAAKSAAEILLKSLKSNDQAGIVLFESGASTVAYLSPFKENVVEKLKAIPPHDGRTALGDGLSLAVDMATSIPNKKKVIILMSDGVNNAGVISPDEAIAFAKANRIQVNTVGLGTNGKTVLGYDWFGNPQYADLDEVTLQSIAKMTGGTYYKSVDSRTLDEIYLNISKDIKREKEETSLKDWFIAAATVLLIVELLMRYGQGRVIQ